MTRIPAKKRYPVAQVLEDTKVSGPRNCFVLILIRADGLSIETWRMSRAKAQVFADCFLRSFQEDQAQK